MKRGTLRLVTELSAIRPSSTMRVCGSMGTVGKHMSPPVANLAIHVKIVFRTASRVAAAEAKGFHQNEISLAISRYRQNE